MEQIVKEDVKEAATQVLARGLVRKVETRNGMRYEITDTGWEFLREYKEIRADLGERASNFAADRNDLLTEEPSPPVSLPLRPEPIEFLNELRALDLQYGVMRPEVGILVPTMNEVKTIGNVLSEISKHMQYPSEVLVVDASDDETPMVAAKFGARVLRQRGNGKGSALRQAFCALDSDIIVMIDGDASMRPEEIPRFVETIISGADIAKGSRFLSYGRSEDLSFVRKVGNLLFVSLVNLIWSARYTDICYGFLAFRADALETLKPHLKSKGFQIETEICIRAKRLGMRIVEIPSVELRRRHGQSKLSGVRDSARILRTIGHEFLSTIRAGH
jgi:hypothetical protein